MSTVKQQLHTLCIDYISTAINSAEAAITDAREAVANETKSSAGDKYETAREMLQQDIDLNMIRLAKAKEQQHVLKYINPEQVNAIAVPGSLVITNNGNFYIATNAGQFEIEGEKYYAISTDSPIGAQLKGKREGDKFSLNGKDYIIDKLG